MAVKRSVSSPPLPVEQPSAPSTAPPAYRIRVLERAFSVLDALARESHEPSLVGLSSEILFIRAASTGS